MRFTSARKLIYRLKERKWVKTIDSSGLFDRAFYLNNYKDVSETGIDPLVHYIRYGADEGRNPSVFFNTSFYLLNNPDIAKSSINPLAHYILHGRAEGRISTALDGQIKYITESGLLDPKYYLEKYTDVAAAGLDPAYHYLASGYREGRNPSALFSTDHYLELHPELVGLGLNPLLHYLAQGGRHEDLASEVGAHARLIAGSGFFDREFYLQRYDPSTGVDPVLHYATTGWREGRNPSPLFSTRRYQSRYLRGSADFNPLIHYLLIGRDRGHSALPPHSKDHEPWGSNTRAEWTALFEHRLAERLEALKSMDLDWAARSAQPIFSLTTTVYDTSPAFLDSLTETIKAQAFKNFEWLILDNGSTDRDTIAACRRIADSDPRFRYFRVEENLHIIGGNAYVFEKAEGLYTIPVDSDDILYPDSLALFGEVLRRSGDDKPVLIYSDEQKIDEAGEPLELIWRWDYSFSHAVATAPAAHLMAFPTALGREVGLYSDDYARGSHDRDAALRITERGGRVEHIREVLYGWRVHSQSTAMDASVKTYIGDSQFSVMEESLRRLGLERKFEIRPVFEGALGWYKAYRKEIADLKLAIDFVIHDADEIHTLKHNLAITEPMVAHRRVLYPQSLKADIEPLLVEARAVGKTFASEAKLSALLSESAASLFAKAIITSTAAIQDPRALWDALGVLELDMRAGIVGGPVIDVEDVVLSAGLLAGLNGFVGSPFSDWRKPEVPGHLWYVARPVTAVPLLFTVVRAALLRQGLRVQGVDRDDALNGLELGLECASMGFEAVYIPSLEVVSDYPLPAMIGAGTDARSRLRTTYAAQLAKGTIPSCLSDQGSRFGIFRRLGASRSSTVEYGAFNPSIPLNLVVDPTLATQPTINVLLPAIRMISMSGGPNTALNLAYQLAQAGFAIRLISTDTPIDADPEPIWRHIQDISGIDQRLPNVQLVDGSNRAVATAIGAKDIFFATAWWTAQMAKHASPLVGGRPFVYLIQDFEPILYAASSHYALAMETYGLDHIPVVNTNLLRDFLTANNVGRHADPAFAADAIAFEPAISRDVFYPETKKPAKRRLLFYARPHTGARNLFEMGVAALQTALDAGDLGAQSWEFIGMGEAIPNRPLSHGATLECAPWLNFEAYARQMREADILLSLMLSPHPSYPPLEMAACGGMVVTNTYFNKTAEQMAAISANIIAAEPTIEDIAAALAQAVRQLPDREARNTAARINLPHSWNEALAPIVKALTSRLIAQGVHPDAHLRPGLNEPRRLAMPDFNAPDPYARYMRTALADRKHLYPAQQEAGLLSFVTTVWNTPPAFLEVLARSVEAQEGGALFEWYILDNGCTRPDVLQFLAKLAERPYVRLERVEENLGIIGGMRYCLERAKGRYILPLDSDDYLTPDCVRIVTWHLQKNGYPALAYSDEDKLLGAAVSGPYLKPDWDPVLFANSCYIAHLCAIDREKALALEAYTDPGAEGSHDWDTFTRFALAGHKPVHVPEVLYSWRLHNQSTAANINSKPIVFDSQRTVLARFLKGHKLGKRFELIKSPLFGGTPDWWLRRRRVSAPGVTTVLVSKDDERRKVDLKVPKGVDHTVVRMKLSDGVDALAEHARVAVAEGRLLHIAADELTLDSDEWFHEAVGHFELFPDTVVVGGRLHSYRHILAAGLYFGFGRGCDCPDQGRPLSDPGYAAQLWKQHSVSAVSSMHAVLKPEFLLKTLEETRAWDPSIALLGAWLGASARRHDRRVVYSPFVSAETTVDWDCLVEGQETLRFASYVADLAPERQLLSADLSLTAGAAYQVERRSVSPAKLPSYPAWYGLQAASRAAHDAPVKTRFSLLTTLYIGTDADLFRRTAETVFAQEGVDFEWIVLVHGPITPGLKTYLPVLERDQRVRLLKLEENLGIIGGMHHVLEAAREDYILPLDGDDLLASDCLRLLAQAIESSKTPPAFLYTDEDIVIGDHLQAPYLRPAWDPVLDLENSWIWHACAFRRDLALQLGVYTFKPSEFCHDWDTVYRFTRAGHAPVHVPAIAYHWRHHERSTSNSGDGHNGSSRSVQALLAAKIEDRGLTDVCEVAPFPIYRGAEEWWIKRSAKALPRMHSVLLSAPDNFGAPPVSTTPSRAKRAPVSPLQQVLSQIKGAAPEDLVVICSTGIHPPDEARMLEAVKIFEFHDDVVMVSGRLVADATVTAAGWMSDGDGRLHAPYDNLALGDPGPFVLGWKPQCISAGVIDLCVVKAGFLREALAAAPDHLALAELGLCLGAHAARTGRRVAFSPLIEGQVCGDTLHPGDPRSAQLVWDGLTADGPSATNRGAAAYGVKRFS